MRAALVKAIGSDRVISQYENKAKADRQSTLMADLNKMQQLREEQFQKEEGNKALLLQQEKERQQKNLLIHQNLRQ